MDVHVPDPVVTGEGGATPEQEALLAGSVGTAWRVRVPIPSSVPKTSKSDASRTEGAIRTETGRPWRSPRAAPPGGAGPSERGLSERGESAARRRRLVTYLRAAPAGSARAPRPGPRPRRPVARSRCRTGPRV